ncbi:hypothetical protein [Desulfosporosinus sp. FKA]|uniref:hypothetical protein n=1 Tax=Desulfosporosinus sp. FKA TaxID=1969834 RepID=UPI000B49DCE4|nr:hypothetical protein [Desulfosporosinus sp. FKA]
MAAYYRYLWSATWPSLIGLFLIWGLVLGRLGWKFRYTWRFEHDALGFIVFGLKVLIWAGFLGVYTELLLLSQPDWFKQPGVIQGSVMGKAYDSRLGAYVLEVGDNKKQQPFYIDHKAYEQIKLKDQVKLTYLPVRRDVVSCEVLKSLH